jgi:TRAP transporter T-component
MALAVDVNREPSTRLANLIAQKRARHLLSRAGSLFSDQRRGQAGSAEGR